MKAQVIGVKDRFQPLRDFHINACVVDKNSRIDKVRLAFNLTAAQRGQKTVLAAPDRHRSASGVCHAVPKRKLPTHEIRIVEDGVKSARPSVCRILIALGQKKDPRKRK